MRILAFLTALAGLVAVGAQAGVLGIAMMWQEKAEWVPFALFVATGGEMAFYALLVFLLLGFAFTRRRRA